MSWKGAIETSPRLACASSPRSRPESPFSVSVGVVRMKSQHEILGLGSWASSHLLLGVGNLGR